MICVLCNSKAIKFSPLSLKNYYNCQGCGLIFQNTTDTDIQNDNIGFHYRDIDPHFDVAISKKTFFEKALSHLESKIVFIEKKILDIGCGYGYFLSKVIKKGWEPYGIEIMRNAVKSCCDRFGYGNVFHGKLIDANLPVNFFDAITLWDVLAIVDNPYNELKECNRLLKKGGIIGIRTRNVSFQKWVYRIFVLVEGIASRFGLKKPYVFNKYCFSRKSLYALLFRLGYTNIKITNSPLTLGDPYNHLPVNFGLKIAKICLNVCSKIVFFTTGGRCLIAPSLLIWAEKP